jgi:hypothetical protein
MTGDPGAGKEAGLPFGDLFAAACSDGLPEREGLIVGRYYGLDGGGCQTLAAVGKSLDSPIGRERVRQIIDRALSGLKGQGSRQRNSGQPDRPCAALRSHAERIADPQAPNWQRTAWEHLAADPSMIPPQKAIVLLAYFAAPHRTWRQAEAAVAPFFQQLREQAHREQREASDQARRTQVATRVQGLLDRYTLWGSSPRTLAPEEVHGLRRRRHVRHDGTGLALPLDSMKLGRQVECEPCMSIASTRRWSCSTPSTTTKSSPSGSEQPFRISWSLDGRPRPPYHPDVLVVLRCGRAIVAEIKPLDYLAYFEHLARWTMLVRFCDSLGYGLYVGDDGHAIQEQLRRPVPPAFEAALVAAAEDHTVRGAEYARLLRRFNANHQDMAAVVLRHGLELRTEPFRLRRPTSQEAAQVSAFLSRLRDSM